jgi:hypothetical protein
VARSRALSVCSLGARIEDLEQKHGYIFRTKDTGREYVYHLLSIHSVPFQKPEKKPVDRAQILKENEERLAWLDNYQSDTATA